MEAQLPEPFVNVSVAPSLVPGGGNGLFALRKFEVGERMAKENLLAALHAEAMEHHDPVMLVAAYEHLVECGQLGNLVREGQGLYRAPADDLCRKGYVQWARQSWPDVQPQQQEEIAEVMTLFAYNSFSSHREGRFHHIYKHASMANHSCAPNALLLAPETGLSEIVCIRTISEGEEVTLSYLHDQDLWHPTPRRLELLQEGWNFVCDCRRCKLKIDDARCFSCVIPDCKGKCFSSCSASDVMLTVKPCTHCGETPLKDTVASWDASERQIATLVSGLPSTLYSAWADCESFSDDHPFHWLVVNWKRHLSSHTENEIERADDQEEREELESETATHRAFWRCAAESILGHRIEVPKEPEAIAA